MKLHLNKALRLAVMAAIVAMGSTAQAITVATDVVRIDTKSDYTADGIKYTASTGEVSEGLSSLMTYSDPSAPGNTHRYLTFSVDMSALGAATGTESIVKCNVSNWGICVTSASTTNVSVTETSIVGTWGNGDAPVWNDKRNGVKTVSSLDSPTLCLDLPSGSSGGLRLSSGDVTQPGVEGTNFYQANALRGSAPANLTINSKYVTALYTSKEGNTAVVSADGLWGANYTNVATNTVSGTPVEATLVTAVMNVAAADAGTLSTNGGDIIVGGTGQLGLAGSISNNIITGTTNQTSAILFDNTTGAITASGAIRLVEDSTMGTAGGGNAVQITGAVSGNFELGIVSGTEIEIRGGLDTAGLNVAGGAAVLIAGQNASVASTSGTGVITVGDGSTLTISGTHAMGDASLATAGTGAIVFADGAVVDVTNMTSIGGIDATTEDGFLSSSYRLAAAGAAVTLSGGSVGLVAGDTSLGSATLSNGVLSMGDAIYNVAVGKTYSEYLAAAEDSGVTSAAGIVVQSTGVFTIDNDSKVATGTPITGTGTLEIAWSGRVQKGGNTNTAAKGFEGDLVVKNGASWLIADGFAFNSIEVEDGGQIGFETTYTGNVTISGKGVNQTSDQRGALKFADGGQLIGDVTVAGATGSLSTWGTHTGNITGNINSTYEGGSDLFFMNGNGSGANTLNLTGNMSGIKSLTTSGGTVNVSGTVSNFGTTFTKDGDGTLVLSKAGAINSGKVVVNGGMLHLTGEGAGGTISGVAVEVNAGATLKVNHDCCGWNGGTSKITLTGSEGKIAKMINVDDTTNGNTWNTALAMNGYAEIEGGKLMTFGQNLSVEGADNTISSQLLIAKTFTVTVADGGELEISGQLSTSAHGQAQTDAKLVKAGAGELKLTNVGNNLTRNVDVNAGTLKLQGAGVTTGTGNLTVASGAKLAVVSEAATTIGNTISGSGDIATSGDGTKNFTGAVTAATLTVDDGAVNMASLNLSGEATLNAGLKVTGDTTLKTTDAAINIANGVEFSTDAGKLTVAGTKTATKITTSVADAVVNTANEAITISNAEVTVDSADNYTLGAKLDGSSLTNVGAGVATVNVAENSSNDFDASKGSITVNAQSASIGDAAIGAGKTLTIGDGTGAATVSGTATIADGGTVSGDLTIADGGKLQLSSATETGFGAIVEGTLTFQQGGTATLTGFETLDLSAYKTDTNLVLATAVDIKGWAEKDVNDFFAGTVTLADKMQGIVKVVPYGVGQYDLTAEGATGQQLVIELTKITTSTTLTLASENPAAWVGNALQITVAENLTGVTGDLALSVDDEQWKALVAAVKTGGYGVGDSVAVTLMGADGKTIDLATPGEFTGTVAFNGYVGEGSGTYQMQFIPEPTTATLSLLALAGLAARRRRKAK